MAKIRKDALAEFDKLPMEKSHYLPLKLDFDALVKDIGKESKIDIRELTENKTDIVVVQANNKIAYTNVPEDASGIIVESIEDALKNHPKLIEDEQGNLVVDYKTWKRFKIFLALNMLQIL